MVSSRGSVTVHLDPPTLTANAANAANTTATIGIGAGILYTRRIPIAIRETLCVPLRSLDVFQLAEEAEEEAGGSVGGSCLRARAGGESGGGGVSAHAQQSPTQPRPPGLACTKSLEFTGTVSKLS